MDILLYIAEEQNIEKTREKEGFLDLWATIHDMNIVGSVLELNDQKCLGIRGLKIIEQMINMYKIEAIGVLSGKDISTDEQDLFAKLKILREMGVRVISAHDDLPVSHEYDNESRTRENHCTIKIYER